MVEIKDPSASRQIRNLITLIFSAVLGAFILGASLVYYYNPSGDYLLKNVLISPEVVTKLSYPEMSPSTGKPVRYIFSRIELVYFDQKNKTWGREQISLDRYQAFYDLMIELSNVSFVTDDVRDSFTHSDPMTLTVVVRREGNDPSMQEAEAFQEVQFVPGSNIFRVQLRTEGKEPVWIYYEFPGIDKKVMAILKA